jgi:transcription elongation factor B subunit 1
VSCVATNARCSGEVVEKVAEYLVYWYRYKDRDDVPEMTMRPEICLEVLRAADYLGLDDSSAPGVNP